MITKTQHQHGYAPINGLSMYYEIKGAGRPLIYLPMGFGVAGTTDFPTLSRDRAVTAVDLQGRGRTADIDRPMSFEQQAEDVVSLIRYLGIGNIDLLGECVGGIVSTIIAIRYPELVDHLVTYGTIFGSFQESYKQEILEGFMGLGPDSEVTRFQRENYERVASDPAQWPAIWSRFGSIQWNGFSDAELRSIKVPTLIAVGDHDWVRPEHSVDTFHRIPDARLAIIPDAGHFMLDAEQEKGLPIIKTFLDAPKNKLPFATTKIGYQRGLTR